MIQNINAARLMELADELGVEPVYLEKDFVLTLIIRTISTGLHGTLLVLKGGQALRHIYGSRRLSKDIDFVSRRRIEFDDLMETLVIRYPRLRFPDKPVGRTLYGFLIRPITYRGPLGVQDSVELEVSFRGDLVLAPTCCQYVSPFCEPFDVLVMDVNEIASEKIRAMYQRGNPRDLYDLWFIFSHTTVQWDIGAIQGLIPHKFRPPLVSGGWQPEKLYDRIHEAEKTWGQSLRALVPGERPSFGEALAQVEKVLRRLRVQG